MWKYSIDHFRPCERIRVGGNVYHTRSDKSMVVYDVHTGKINDVCTCPTHPIINYWHPNYYSMCRTCKYLNPNTHTGIL